MERGERVVLITAVLMIMVMASCPKVVEGVISIAMNPCTPPACIEACKKLLKEKFKDAHCYGGDKFCMCFGGSSKN